MTSSITALTPLLSFSQASTVRPISEEFSQRTSSATGRRESNARVDNSERVIEGELLGNIAADNFSIEDIIGSESLRPLDPRLASPHNGQSVAANDAVAAYVGNSAVFSGVQQRVDTFA